VSVTVCGEPLALSATLTEALSPPAEAGVKVTVIVQLAPAASEVPQVLPSLKLLALAPVMEMPVMVSGAVPGFDRVVDCVVAEVPTSVLGNVSVLEVNVACGAVPVPVRAAVCGEPVALSTTDIEALRLPAEAGVNVTVMVQLAPAASEVPQLLLSPKLLELVPMTEMLVMVSAAVPAFDSVIGKAVAAVPIKVPGKASGFGVRAACGVGAVVPVPVRVTVWGEPDALSATESVAEKLVAEAGVKLISTRQLVPAASVVPQVVADVVAKSLGFVPVMLMTIPVSVALPVFDRVTGRAAAVDATVVFGKASGFGLSPATGAAVPLPVSVTVCGEPDALSATESVAEKLVAEAGVKLT
jgi:hypothetical protein